MVGARENVDLRSVSFAFRFINGNLIIFFAGLPDFPLPISLAHNLAAVGHHHHHHHPSHPQHSHHHPATAAPPPPSEFWPANFALHYPGLMQPNPALLHPNYKLPNFHAILSQYMGLNNLGLFGYSQNLSENMNNNRHSSPDASPKESPNLKDSEK